MGGDDGERAWSGVFAAQGWCCGARVFVVLLINHQLLKIRYAILARVLDPCSPLMRLDLNAGCRAVGP